MCCVVLINAKSEERHVVTCPPHVGVGIIHSEILGAHLKTASLWTVD